MKFKINPENGATLIKTNISVWSYWKTRKSKMENKFDKLATIAEEK